MKLNGNLVLNTLGQSEVRNLVVERVSTTPAFYASEAGRIIFNTTDSKYYINNGTVWVDVATGGNAASLQTELDKLEVSLGSVVSADGTFNASAVEGSNIVNATSLTDAINQLDTAISAKNELKELLDVNVAGVADAQFLRWDQATSKWVAHTLVAASLTDVTATAAEINFLSGVTSSVQTQLGNEVTARTNAVSAVQAELDATQTGAGLNADGTFTAPVGSDFLDTATSLKDAAVKLDAALAGATAGYKAADALIQAELDATQTGAGLSATGAYVAPTTSNYLNATTTLANADLALDAATKTVANALAQEVTDRGTADTALQASIDTKVSKTGDNMTGNLVMSTGTHITVPDAPVNGTDVVNLAFVDARLNGLRWKDEVRAKSTGNVDLATGGLLVLDDVQTVAGDRVLLGNQTNDTENGIYVVSAGAWVRSEDMNDTSPINEVNTAAVFVREGTVFALSPWVQNKVVNTLGTDPVGFTQFNGASSVSPGVGIGKLGNTLFLNLGAGIAELPTDEIGIDVFGTGGLQLVDPATGIASTDATSQIAVKRDGTTLTVSVDGLRVNQTILDSIADNVTAISTETTARSNADTAIQAELDATQTGAGLSAAGAYVVVGSANYISSATTLAGATVALDTAVKAEADARTLAVSNLQTELDATQTGAGLGADGSYSANATANYISTATSLKIADNQLDAAIKAEVDARTTAVSDLNAKVNKGYFLYTSGAAATVHTISHNIGSQFCNVTVIDAATNEQVIPNSVVFDSATQTTVTFNTAIQCKVVVIGLGV